jgi:two-component system, sensor histidine kinase and response regulator
MNTSISTTPSSADFRALKVLVVEDNVINQRLVVAMLQKLGHTGVVVGDGEKALKCLTKLQFDAVLMDVMMPVMDGIEALQAIRLQEVQTGVHLPVVMATAHAEPGDAERFHLAGADGYVIKPIEITELGGELRRVTALSD